jgi:hypothetical protein
MTARLPNQMRKMKMLLRTTVTMMPTLTAVKTLHHLTTAAARNGYRHHKVRPI